MCGYNLQNTYFVNCFGFLTPDECKNKICLLKHLVIERKTFSMLNPITA